MKKPTFETLEEYLKRGGEIHNAKDGKWKIKPGKYRFGDVHPKGSSYMLDADFERRERLRKKARGL